MSEAEREPVLGRGGGAVPAAYAYEETLAAFGDRPGAPDSLLPAYERITAPDHRNAVTALPPRQEWLRLRTWRQFSRTLSPLRPRSSSTSARRTSCGPSGSPRCWPAPESLARLVGEQLAPAGCAGTRAEVIAVVSESYLPRLRILAPSDRRGQSCSSASRTRAFPPHARRGARHLPGRPIESRGGGPADRPVRRQAAGGAGAGRPARCAIRAAAGPDRELASAQRPTSRAGMPCCGRSARNCGLVPRVPQR